MTDIEKGKPECSAAIADDAGEGVSSELDSSQPKEEEVMQVGESSMKAAHCRGLSCLCRKETQNLILLVLCYACTISSMTLIVGSSAVVVKSVGGSNDVAPFALGSFLLGSAVVSLVTSPLFSRFGRKIGFICGNSLGLLGAGLGGIAIWISSPALVIFSCLPLGSANGIGMYLRFAAIEVVSPSAKSFAVTLVLSGGCIAAFAGPESGQATKDIFGDDLLYLGLFMMIAIFNTCNAAFMSLVEFPRLSVSAAGKEDADGPDEGQAKERTIASIVTHRSFLIPVSFATLCWAIMTMPMSIVRVALNELGFSQREGLLVIELHFLGMFSPGFVTGRLIERYGYWFTFILGVAFFASACISNLLADSADDGTLTAWIVGMVTIGVGWNLIFASSTVMLSSTYADTPRDATRVQAANDFIMFGLSGCFLFSTGYIYQAGGNGLDGWKTVNWTVVGLVGVLALSILVCVDVATLPFCGGESKTVKGFVAGRFVKRASTQTEP